MAVYNHRLSQCSHPLLGTAIRARVSYRPAGRTLPLACFHMSSELRMTFVFIKDYKKQKEYATQRDLLWPTKPEIFT